MIVDQRQESGSLQLGRRRAVSWIVMGGAAGAALEGTGGGRHPPPGMADGHRHVLALVIGQALALTAAGIACGIAAALGVNRLLGRLLYEISPTDPASYALIALSLAGVAVLASALPARRALDADPLEALRHE